MENSNSLSLGDFKESQIIKSFNSRPLNVSRAEFKKAVMDTLSKNLESKLINKETFDKAVEQLEKAMSGEGAKGGKVIGHTKSGKPVYAKKIAGHKDYSDFSVRDHRDAAENHRAEAYEHRKKQNESISSYSRDHHNQMSDWHSTTADVHDHKAKQKEQQEHDASTHPDEKKIVADQKKKLADHHAKMRDMHEDIWKYIIEKHGKAQHENSLGQRHPDVQNEIRRHRDMADYHHNEHLKHSE